ncbi:MAG TPA: carboxypeptidase-like regulatory domain-containing protein [Longimicrobiales bacterium]|nr:carboxypeptidase-like regulatory domain-containing protein [Longimicrobiales bacterium]
MITLLLFAQIQLHGVVRDSTTNSPIPAALVTLQDAQHRPIARTLTRENGSFGFATTSTGSLVIAEFIGYAPSQRAVTSNQDPISFKLRPMPVKLAGIVAETKRQCRKSDDPRVVPLWYAARAALGSSRVRIDRRFRTMEFTRFVDLQLRFVDYDTIGFSVTRGTDSYEAMPVDSIEAYGYVVGKDHRVFYGPDAELLLSDQFADKHCFGITRDSDHRGQIGLEYWPKDGVKKPDVKGAMWIDESFNELRSVEFSYTGLKPWIAEKLATGIVNFGRMNDGSWVVVNWFIRSPRYDKQTFDNDGRSHNVLVGGIEGGGEFLGLAASSMDAADTTSITGSVSDMAAKPLAHVPIYLAGTEYATETDASGRFELNGVSSGIYYIAFFTPTYALLPLHTRAQRVELARNKPFEKRLKVPSDSAIVNRLCADSTMTRARHKLRWKGDLAVVAGRVTSGNAPVAGARVEILWDAKTVPSSELDKKVSSLFADTDVRGRYIACGIPASLDGTIRVFRDGVHLLTEQFEGGPLVHARDFVMH